ncbi:MAG TPA: YafY family protein [Ktedonobacterales bacterium]
MRAAYSPATRLLALLDLLQSRPRVQAAEVVAALGVEARSARRYITMLQDMGIPVEARRGRYGGYALRPGYKLPPLMLTDDEAQAITLGLMAARNLGVAEIETATAGALAKVERVLPAPVRERVLAMSEAVALDTPRPASAVSPARADLIALCSAASRAGRRVTLRYRQREGAESERGVDCYGVVHSDGRWYLVGYCHLRQSIRTFRLDRTRSVTLREERFTRPRDFDCLAYAIAAFAAIPDEWLIEALLHMPFEEASSVVPPSFATLEESAHGVRLRAYDRSLDHAARFLLNLGCPFEIIAPAALLKTFEGLAREVMAMVERSAHAYA